ncbi:MAG: hypothetical protein WDN24_03115 [Sphingomonas sp.]
MGEDAPARVRRTGYRVPAPAADALVAWPESFGTRFTLFVDTEEEFDWGRPVSRDQRGTSAIAALPALHRRFADRGVAVAYLVDHPIATDPAAIDAIRAMLADGRSSVGTQLHPWVSPPFEEEIGVSIVLREIFPDRSNRQSSFCSPRRSPGISARAR